MINFGRSKPEDVDGDLSATDSVNSKKLFIIFHLLAI